MNTAALSTREVADRAGTSRFAVNKMIEDGVLRPKVHADAVLLTYNRVSAMDDQRLNDLHAPCPAHRATTSEDSAREWHNSTPFSIASRV